jgi:hypothetical protein
MLYSMNKLEFVMSRTAYQKSKTVYQKPKKQTAKDNQDKFFLYVIFFHLFTAISNIFKD